MCSFDMYCSSPALPEMFWSLQFYETFDPVDFLGWFVTDFLFVLIF